MDSETLADLVDEMVAIGGFDSVTVVRNGHVVLHTTIYPFLDDTGHGMYSVTKSVVGTLIGIAIDRSLLAGVDVPVVDLLPEAAPESPDDRTAGMTVEHLLTMTTGLECRDSAMLESDDWAAHVLSLPMRWEPGARFEYCNGASHLLSAIITEVTGVPASEFADEVLFDPLGITDVVWPSTSDGLTIGFSELVLRPSDAAKIGYLYLRHGEWDGHQIVSRSWVDRAGTPQIAVPGGSGGYGYQWWIHAGGKWISARGAGGQTIYVIPDLDLVVGFTAGFPEYQSGPLPDQMMQSHVLPAWKPNPLPPDPDGQARLAAATAAAHNGPPASPVALPEVAQTIDGARYEFPPGQSTLEWFSFDFGAESAQFEIASLYAVDIRGFEGLGDPIEAEIGLTGRYEIGELFSVPTAWRGQWITDDAFLIDFQMLTGANLRGTFEFTFEDDTAIVELKVAEGEPLEATANRAG